MIKNILIVTYNLHSMGGIQRSTSNIANGLSEAGYLVNIASISPGLIPMNHPLNENIKVITCNSDISVRQKAISTNFGLVARKIAGSIFSYWKPRRFRFVKPQREGILKLRREIRKYDRDETLILVTDVNSMDYVNAALAEYSGPFPAIIGQYKGSVAALSRSRLTRIVNAYRNADLLLGLTPEDAAALRPHTTVPTDWIANPIPKADLELEMLSKERQFVTMGRFSPEKGLLEALKAWKIASSSLPQWKLVMYGDGPLRTDIEKEISKLSLQDKVHLAGKTSDPVRAMASAAALILPSEHEGFGMVVAEAASAGTPTIAYNCSPGVRMQIESEVNGILVNQNDSVALASAMQRVALDPDFSAKLGQNAKRMVQQFEVGKIIERWTALFELAGKAREMRISSGD